jgi:N-acyl homoserine lactone hydrolase
MALKVSPMVCGWLEVQADFILAKEPGRLRLPIPSFLIEHPKGRVVFDTGLHRELQTSTSRIGPLAKAFNVHFKAGEELGGRLRARADDPAAVRA